MLIILRPLREFCIRKRHEVLLIVLKFRLEYEPFSLSLSYLLGRLISVFRSSQRICIILQYNVLLNNTVQYNILISAMN